MACLNLFAVTLCLIITGTAHGFNMHQQRLRADLLTNYDKHALPADTTTVNFRLTIKHFQMIEESQTLLVDSWMVNEWMDPRLSWDPEVYDSITKLTVPHSMLWKPDLGVYNSATVGEAISYGNTLLIVFYNGRVLFVPPVQLHFTCVMDLTYWPHDTHNCTCVFGSWVHDGFAIDLQIMDDKPEMDLPMRMTDGRNLTRGTWDLLNASIVRDVKTYECCAEPYITIHMSMMVTRNAPAYAWVIKGPALGLTILTLVVFLLPPAAGEKMIFGVLCLILDMIFIGYTSFIITLAPSHTPLIVKMMCKQVLLVIGSIVVGAQTLRLARDPHTTGLPTFMQRTLIFFSTFLCLHNYRNLVWEVSRTNRQAYARSLKSDECELRENGNGQVLTGGGGGGGGGGELRSNPGHDWVLLAAVIDRICLIIFIAIFVVNAFAFSSVL